MFRLPGQHLRNESLLACMIRQCLPLKPAPTL
jgi:hypothetical protein